MTDHKAVAEALSALLADNAAPLPADAASMGVVAQAAAVHALLALVEGVGELVEQQRTANLVAVATGAAPAFEDFDVDWGNVEETILHRLGMIEQKGESH